MLRAVALCAVAGALAQWLALPLPWMIGPLLAMAAGKAAGIPLAAPGLARDSGQLTIAVALGLYFTPAVAAEVARYLPWMLVAGVFAIAIGIAAGRICVAIMGRSPSGSPELDRTTAYFACVPGGASEMAVLAARHGGRVDRVAFAQSLRILIVVMTLPFIYKYAGIYGLGIYSQAAPAINYAGLAGLIALAGCGGLVLYWLKLPNPFMLGPLLVTVLLTASGLTFSAMPGWLSAAAQLLLGWSLGDKFERDFFRTAPRFMVAVLAATLAAMGLSTILAMLLWQGADIHPATGVLAVAPGGIAEMCITAKVMRQGVPIVTAFHVARVVMLVLFAGKVYKRWLAARPH
ncbi:MAG: AbrB family transcriptional regulator [Burkholderiales bacterium]|nr:AbrB family transcriptional regulator [Burkholderiales bacterium]